MTSAGKAVLSALLIDLRNEPSVTPQMAAQAIILTTQRARLPLEDFREMNSVMRTEFGITKDSWEQMVASLISQLPNTAQIIGTVE